MKAFQYSLRSLLWAITLVCVAGAAISWIMVPRDDKARARRLEAAGAKIDFMRSQTLLGSESIVVRGIQIDGHQNVHEVLNLAAQCRELRALRISSATLDEHDMHAIESCPRLERLALRECAVAPPSRSLRGLKSLQLRSCELPEDFLSIVARSEELYQINTYGSKLSSNDLAFLSKQAFSRIELGHTQARHSDLQLFLRRTGATSLGLAGLPVSNEDLRDLSASVVSMNLSDTKVSGQGITPNFGAKCRWLELRRTAVDDSLADMLAEPDGFIPDTPGSRYTWVFVSGSQVTSRGVLKLLQNRRIDGIGVASEQIDAECLDYLRQNVAPQVTVEIDEDEDYDTVRARFAECQSVEYRRLP
jgi:hypothetical protein